MHRDRIVRLVSLAKPFHAGRGHEEAIVYTFQSTLVGGIGDSDVLGAGLTRRIRFNM